VEGAAGVCAWAEREAISEKARKAGMTFSMQVSPDGQ
jgi:hypothetical protein